MPFVVDVVVELQRVRGERRLGFMRTDETRINATSARIILRRSTVRFPMRQLGVSVPAMTFKPLDNISLANCFASFSVGNDFDSRGAGARGELGRHSLGLSMETYQ